MMWLLLFMGSLSLVLIVKDVQPVWTQHLAFGTSLAVLCMYIFSSFKINTGKFGSWCRKNGFKWVVVFFLGVMVFAGKQYEVIIDYSRGRIYELRPETIEWIRKIDVPITLSIFVSDDNQTQANANWLNEQIGKNTNNVTVAIKNFNRDVLLVEKYGVAKPGEAVLTAEDFWVKIDSFQEQDLLLGLMRLLSRSDATLCFLVGHGEPDITDQNEIGLFGLSGYLQSLGYKVKTVDLETKSEDTQTLDKICGALFIVSPKTAFLDSEKMVLSTLMKTDLPMVMGLDLPVTKAVADLLADEGLVLSSQIIMNKNNISQKIPVTDLVVYPKDVQTISGDSVNKKMYFPNVQALEIKDSSQGISYSSAIETMAEEGYSLLTDETKPGPFIVSAVGSRGAKPVRAIFGSGDWLRTKSFDYGDNRQLILGAVRWILAESQIGQADLTQAPLANEKYMEVSETERWWIKVFCMYLIPAFFGLLCFTYWFQRKVRS